MGTFLCIQYHFLKRHRMATSTNNQSEQAKSIQFNDFFFIDFDDESFLDTIDLNLENDEYDMFQKNKISLPDSFDLKTNTTFSFNDKANAHPIVQQKNKKCTKSKSRTKSNPKNNVNIDKIKIQDMNPRIFNEYLNIKINKEKQKKVSKETLVYMYNKLQDHLKMPSLSREDRRDKKKIFNKLYKFSSEIYECFETDPQTFLHPVIMFSGIKFFQRYKNFEKVDDLKNALNLNK